MWYLGKDVSSQQASNAFTGHWGPVHPTIGFPLQATQTHLCAPSVAGNRLAKWSKNFSFFADDIHAIEGGGTLEVPCTSLFRDRFSSI